MSLLELHSCISYLSIAPLIDMEPVSKYAVSVNCPYCFAKSLSIHQDNRNLEEWYYCYQCKATGSVIAMAAERLKMPEQACIQYLANQLGQTISPKSLDNYYKSCEIRRKHLKLWEYASSRNLNPTPQEIDYLKFLGFQLRTPMSQERLAAGPHKLYGLSHADAVKAYLGKGRAGSFRKKDPIAVIPFYRTPSIIAGFSCISPNKRIDTNTNASNQNARSIAKGEPGFAGLQFLSKFQSESIVATSMLPNMVRLQMHHFSSNMNPLPLVSWVQQPVCTVQKQWSILSDRQLIMWEKFPTAAVVHQAMMCDAYVSFVSPPSRRTNPYEVDGQPWKKWIRKVPAIDSFRKIVSSAKPIEQALKNWARIATSGEKVKLLQEAEQYEERTADLVRSVINPKIANKVGKRVRVGSVDKKKAVSGSQTINKTHSRSFTVIVEKDGMWYDRDGKVRLPAILRVTHLVVRPDGETEYVGYLQVNQNKFEFHVKQKDANSTWLKTFGLHSGVLLEEDFTWYSKSSFNPFDAAMQFEKPEVVPGLTRIGWDGTGFQFKSAKLVDGKFLQNPDFKLPPDAPGPNTAFCALKATVKDSLARKCKELEVTWALALALCSQVTSPCVGLEPSSVWIKRKKSDLFFQTLLKRFQIKKGAANPWNHYWPRRIDARTKALKETEDNFFVSRYVHTPGQSITHATVVEANDENLEPRLISWSADKIVLNYLRRFTSENHNFDGSCEEWLELTKDKLISYFDFASSETILKGCARVKIL